MASIALNKPSGGQLILSPEDGTSTETVTIPSVGVGKVLQVVTTEVPSTAHISTTSTSYTEAPSNYSVTITPTKIGTKMIVTLTVGMQFSDTGVGCISAITKNGSIVTNAQYPNFSKTNSTPMYTGMRMEYTDVNISSTSPIVYNMSYKSETGGSIAPIHGGTRYTITVMEVSA